MTVKIFFCYAREDEPLLIRLKAHLRPLQRMGLIDVWYDRDISAGTEWEQDIKKHLDEANIILLLISPNFMDSDYCYGTEMKRAVQRHEQKTARVIPVILRHVLWKVPPIGKLQVLPTDGKPILSADWYDPDEAFYIVAESIQKLAEELDTSSSPFASQVTEDTKNLRSLKPLDRPVKRLPSSAKRIGLFLDYENILPLLPSGTKHREVGALLADYASSFGEVICRWVCIDPRQYSDYRIVQRGLQEAGFSIRLPRGDLLVRQSKSVSDFVLVECITEESIRSQPDVYILISGDSDYFERVVSLIESGYIVRLVAAKKNMASKYRWLEEQRRQSRLAQGYVDSDFFIDDLDSVLKLATPGDK